MSAFEKDIPDSYEIYTPPGDYLKFKADGEWRIRCLSKPLCGWEYWEEDAGGKKKPIRIPLSQSAKPPTSTAKEFWAITVWNYSEQCVQVLSIKQVTIIRELLRLIRDEDWGSPRTYDLKIKRETRSGIIKYAVSTVKPSAVPKAAISALKERPCQLEALFHGLDPFGGDELPEMEEAPAETEALSEDLQVQFVGSLPKGLDMDKINEYVQMCASRNSCSVQKVYESALVEMTRFIDVFKKWSSQ